MTIEDEDVHFPFKIVGVPNRAEFTEEDAINPIVDFRTYFESWEPTYNDDGTMEPVVLFDLWA